MSDIIKMDQRGVRGESWADVARRVGVVSGIPIPNSATDAQALDLMSDDFLAKVEAAGYTIIAHVATATSAANGDGDIALSGEQTIAGVLTSTSRVLLTTQTDPAENGIWVTAAGAWSRATDFDETSEVVTGSLVPVLNGENAGSFVLMTTGTITVGTTGQVWRVRDLRSAGKIQANGGGTVQDAINVALNPTALLATTGTYLVGSYIRTANGFVYEVVSSGEDVTTAGGVKLRVVPDNQGFVNVHAFGAVADTTELVIGTDNATAFQSALDSGYPVTLMRPATGYAYGISQISLNRGSVLVGCGQYILAIRGITTDSTIIGGGVSDAKREVTLRDLYVENNRGGDAANLEYCPDFNITRCYLRSVSNGTLGTTASRGLNLRNSERGQFSGQCRVGGNPAIRMVKDCNGVRADNIIASGGTLGRAVDISGCQTVKIPFTIETSLYGIRIGDNTNVGVNDNSTEGGWGSGIDLSDSYFESVGTPIEAGHAFAVNGLKLDNCWLQNSALSGGSPFPVSSEILRIGRVKNLSLNGGRWVGAGTETALKLLEYVTTSGSAPGMLETADVDLTVFENVATLLDVSAITSAANRSTCAATNKVYTNDAKTTGLGIPFDWISEKLTANVTYGSVVLSAVLASGGRITSAELIEGSGGSLNGARVRVGDSTDVGSALDLTFGAVSHTYYNFGVTNGLIRSGGDIRMRLDAGAGGGTFRLKLRGMTGNI